MLDYLLKLNLQLFAEGGDGGSAGEGTADSAAGEIEVPAGIPDRAVKNYKAAVKKTAKPVAQTTNEQNVTTDNQTKRTYDDLIKSEEYKEEHQAYMEKTIGDRLKRYKGVEEENGKMRSVLETVASKYSLDATSETFLEDLTKKVAEDNSYYENYAVEHEITPEEARRVVELERQVRQNEQVTILVCLRLFPHNLSFSLFLTQIKRYGIITHVILLSILLSANRTLHVSSRSHR